MQELGEPAEGRGVEVFRWGEGAGEEEGGGVGDGEAPVAFSAEGVVVEGLGSFGMVSCAVKWLLLRRRWSFRRIGKVEVLERTFEYHFKASSGISYCFAFSSRSLTSLGKTASKSWSLLDGALVVASGTSPSASCWIF